MNRLFLFPLLLVSLSCQNTDIVAPEDRYNSVSNDFVSKLLEFGEFNCDCIIEPTYTLLDYSDFERPEDNLTNYMMLRANLKSKSDLDSLNTLSRKVDLNETIVLSGYKLISKRQADTIAMIRNRKVKRRILDSICPKGFMVMTKPFFNKSMDTVFIIADDMPHTCFSSFIGSYYFINEAWIIPTRL